MNKMSRILVNIRIPELGESYDVYIPSSKTIESIIILVYKALNDITMGEMPIPTNSTLINANTKEVYDKNKLLSETNIINGTKLILLS